MVMLKDIAGDYPHKLQRLYWPFLSLEDECAAIEGGVAGDFECYGHRYTIPRFIYRGPAGSTPPLRIGVFALVHGDEPAGALALQLLLEGLMADPSRATGYELVLYPLCNPTGYEDGTRMNRAGYDLNREFWIGSGQPEVGILQEELGRQHFDGIIALHADDTCDGIYGYSQGRLLNEELLRPALQACTGILPLDRREVIDGFAAHEGVICDCYAGILAPPPTAWPRPFEIVFETPALAPVAQQAEAAHCALLSLLTQYRSFIAQAINL